MVALIGVDFVEGEYRAHTQEREREADGRGHML
jgi:hypothetical protein